MNSENILNSLPKEVVSHLTLQTIENINVLSLIESLHIVSSHIHELKRNVDGLKSEAERQLVLSQIDFLSNHENAIKNQLRFIRKKADTALGLESWASLLKESHKIVKDDALSLRESHSLDGKIVDNDNLGVEKEVIALEELAGRLYSAIL